MTTMRMTSGHKLIQRVPLYPYTNARRSLVHSHSKMPTGLNPSLCSFTRWPIKYHAKSTHGNVAGCVDGRDDNFNPPSQPTRCGTSDEVERPNHSSQLGLVIGSIKPHEHRIRRHGYRLPRKFLRRGHHRRATRCQGFQCVHR